MSLWYQAVSITAPRQIKNSPEWHGFTPTARRPGTLGSADLRARPSPRPRSTAYFDDPPLGGAIGVGIALDEATVENGCMQVIPGSHLDGPAKHYHVRDCQLEHGGVRVDRAVVVPLRPGGALFFSGMIHHGTPPNTSGDRRRALQFHYAAASCTRMTIREHGALFDDNGAYAGCRDWDLEADLSRARIEI